MNNFDHIWEKRLRHSPLAHHPATGELQKRIMTRVASLDTDKFHKRRFGLLTKGMVSVATMAILVGVGLYFTTTTGLLNLRGNVLGSHMSHLKITQNSLTAEEQSKFETLGFILRNSSMGTNKSEFVTPQDALNSTADFVKTLYGKSENIHFVIATRTIGHGFAKPMASLTHGDPYFQKSSGLLKDIPCYLITVNDVHSFSGGAVVPNKTTGQVQMPTDNTATMQMNILVDASNSKTLLTFYTGKD